MWSGWSFLNSGVVVRDARRSHGFTQGELAKLAGVGRNTISKIKNGSFDELGVRKIERVCAALRLSLSVGPFSLDLDAVTEEIAAAQAGDQRMEKSIGDGRACAEGLVAVRAAEQKYTI
jgi:transcriptional regulator with XRE-family HTH domain